MLRLKQLPIARMLARYESRRHDSARPMVTLKTEVFQAASPARGEALHRRCKMRQQCRPVTATEITDERR